MLCILLGIITKILSIYAILLRVPCTWCSTGNRINISPSPIYAAMGLWGGAKDAETAKVKVKQIR